MAALQLAMFMKNISMLGGALLITQFGAGPQNLESPRKPRSLKRPGSADQPPRNDTTVGWATKQPSSGLDAVARRRQYFARAALRRRTFGYRSAECFFRGSPPPTSAGRRLATGNT